LVNTNSDCTGRNPIHDFRAAARVSVIGTAPPEKSQVKVRLYGIDTPEKGQAFGAKRANFIK